MNTRDSLGIGELAFAADKKKSTCFEDTGLHNIAMAACNESAHARDKEEAKLKRTNKTQNCVQWAEISAAQQKELSLLQPIIET